MSVQCLCFLSASGILHHATCIAVCFNEYKFLHVDILLNYCTHCRFWNLLGEKKVSAVWKPNEDFCHIVVDDGMFDDHLPDGVTSAIDRLYNQHVTGNDQVQKRTSVYTNSTLFPTGFSEEAALPMVDIKLDSQHEHAVKCHKMEDVLTGSNQQQVKDIPTNGQTIVIDLVNQYTETTA